MSAARAFEVAIMVALNVGEPYRASIQWHSTHFWHNIPRMRNKPRVHGDGTPEVNGRHVGDTSPTMKMRRSDEV